MSPLSSSLQSDSHFELLARYLSGWMRAKDRTQKSLLESADGLSAPALSKLLTGKAAPYSALLGVAEALDLPTTLWPLLLMLREVGTLQRELERLASQGDNGIQGAASQMGRRLEAAQQELVKALERLEDLEAWSTQRDKPPPTLRGWRKGVFDPRSVIVGDRRNHAPSNLRDIVLAPSSSEDCTFLPSLRLPAECRVRADISVGIPDEFGDPGARPERNQSPPVRIRTSARRVLIDGIDGRDGPTELTGQGATLVDILLKRPGPHPEKDIARQLSASTTRRDLPAVDLDGVLAHVTYRLRREGFGTDRIRRAEGQIEWVAQPGDAEVRALDEPTSARSIRRSAGPRGSRAIDWEPEIKEAWRTELDHDVLVVGSPTVNYVARYLNRWSVFRFVVPRRVEKFDQDIRRAHHSSFPAKIADWLRSTDVSDRKMEYLVAQMLLDYSRAGFIDPLAPMNPTNPDRSALSLHWLDGIDGQAERGMITLAPHPWNEHRSCVWVAGTRRIPTMAGVRALSEAGIFDERPLGGVFRVMGPEQGAEAQDRLHLPPIDWVTPPYDVPGLITTLEQRRELLRGKNPETSWTYDVDPVIHFVQSLDRDARFGPTIADAVRGHERTQGPQGQMSGSASGATSEVASPSNPTHRALPGDHGAPTS